MWDWRYLWRPTGVWDWRSLWRPTEEQRAVRHVHEYRRVARAVAARHDGRQRGQPSALPIPLNHRGMLALLFVQSGMGYFIFGLVVLLPCSRVLLPTLFRVRLPFRTPPPAGPLAPLDVDVSWPLTGW